MEADFLRLILLLLGIVVVLGVYFWERHKRINARVHAIRRGQMADEEAGEEVAAREHAVPRGPAKTALKLESEEAVIEQELSQLGEIVGKKSDAGLEPVEQMPLFFPDEDLTGTADTGEPMIIQINLVAQPGRAFSGRDILEAAAEAGLEPGDMSIFHRPGEARGKRKAAPLYSMASMVEPGAFPLDDMDGFSTPGLVLFLQLPGPKDGLALFNDMLAAAEKLAGRLGGELQDATHSTLTRQALEHQREEIVEYQRRLKLASRK